MGTVKDVRVRERLLRESEAGKSGALHFTSSALPTMEPGLTEFNRAAERTFGYRREDALGGEFATLLIPPADRQRHRQGLAHYSETGEGPILDRRVELTALRADGTEFPIELSVSRVPTASPPMFTAFVLDKREERFMDAAKLRFRALARADVAHKRREHRRAGRRNPRYRQLNGELHAVRSQRGQFNPPVENRPLAGFQVMGKPLTVTLTIGGWDKEGREFAAEHILTPVTKGALGGAIELGNRPVVGNADDAIQGRFERSAFARLALAQQSLAHTHRSCGPQQQRRQQADFDNRPDRRAQRGIHPAPLLSEDSQTAQGHGKHDDKRQNMAHENPGRAVLEQRLHYTVLGDADDKADAQRENHRRGLQGNAGQAQSIGLLGAIDVADDREQSDRRHRHAHSGGNASPARPAWQQHQRAADEQERHRSRHAHAPG